MSAGLTKSKIDSAKPRDRRYVIWDLAIPGFGCVIHPTGRKVFVLKYRTLDGTVRKPSIGPYGSLTVQQAREEARQLLATVRQGKDPSAVRQESRKGYTVNEACDRFLKEHASFRKFNTRSQYETIIRRYIKPNLGSRKVASITHSDVARLLASIGKEYPIMANRVRAVLSKLFALSERWGLRPRNSNPVQDIDRYTERRRHRDLSEIELRRLAVALKESESEVETPCAIDAIRLLLFVGARRNEIIELRWSEVDKERALLRLGDSKTGEKVIHLNSAALEIVDTQEPLLDNPYVFPSPTKPKSHITIWDLRKAWEHVRAKAGLEARDEVKAMRLHDLRHSYASIAAGQGLSLHQIGALLGHKQPRTTQRYADLQDNAARQASERVGRRIAEAMKSTEEMN